MRTTARETIDALGKEIGELRSLKIGLQNERDMLQRENEHLREKLREEQDYTQVLAGDRDRLTATIEVMSRRLASPNAERLLARAGWRANNLVPSGRGGAYEPLNQKATDRLSSH